MTAHVPRLPFSLEPLIQEAKRRARQRRVLIAGVIVLVAGAVAGGVLAARSPGGPGAGSGGGANIQSLFRADPTQPPVTAASIGAAHRDEVRMLGLFVPPPGAKRVAYEPAFRQPQAERILGRNTWEIGPALSDKFARFAYWRVRSPVAVVASFERAHLPGGWLTAGRYVGGTRPHGPAHRNSTITFSPIPGLVIDRWMYVWIVRLPDHWTAIRVAVRNHPWSPWAIRQALQDQQVNLSVTRQAPVAGHSFTGVEVVDVNPRITPLVRVACNGTLGHRALPVVQHVFATTPPPGFSADLARLERVSKVEAVTCTWQIPANAAGERLQLGRPGKVGTGLVAYTAATPSHGASTISMAPFWVVRP